LANQVEVQIELASGTILQVATSRSDMHEGIHRGASLGNVVKYGAFAVILIILGVGLSQSGDSDPFLSGLGLGIVAMGSIWVAIRLIKEIKKK
jgi:hypothetical protein